jgi:glycosyltransferase involved in cell wall biosynthesis
VTGHPRRLLVLAPVELTIDPRARRAAIAARERDFEVVGLCGPIAGLDAAPLDGVPVVRVGRPLRPHRGWARASSSSGREPLPLRELRGLVRLLRLAARTATFYLAGRRLGGFQIVLANDLDTLPAGWLLARRTGARLVYDAHEIYSAFEAHPPRLQHALSLRLERALTHRAAAVTTVSEPIADELERVLRLSRRPLVVPNAPERREGELRQFTGPLRAIYQGSLGPGRSLDDLLAASGVPDVALALRILFVDSGELREVVAARGLSESTSVLEPVTPDAAVDALRDFEVGLIFDRPQSRNIELSAPNKLYEYLMAGLAIVAPRLPGLTPLVEGEGVGVTFEPGRPEALRAALADLARDRPRVEEMRLRAHRLALERLNAESGADALAAALFGS